jgi:hypothetical protein
MKNTLIIAYNGGTYGSYLEHVLNSLMSSDDIRSPLTELGNSHNSPLGNYLDLGGLDGFRKYLNTDDDFLTAKIHPKIHKNESIQSNLNFFIDNARHVILLYPDRSHELMCVCNYITKIWNVHPYLGAMSYIDPQDIFQGYGLDPDTDLCSIPLWIQREHMSFNLFAAWQDQVEWYLPDQWHDPRSLIISTKQLLDDFENTLISIESFWGKKYQHPIADVFDLHQTMLGLQPHLGKDQICNDILKIILNDQEHIEFHELCLVSQAWIQYRLRQLGYEIQCDGLNDFPTNTQHLKSLIYRT